MLKDVNRKSTQNTEIVSWRERERGERGKDAGYKRKNGE